MKSKAEIIDALKRCRMKEWTCDQCKYYPLGDHCWDALHSDLLEYLSKSDFEAMKEILKRSKEAGYHHYTAISGIECLEIPFLRFDEEGNIL